MVSNYQQLSGLERFVNNHEALDRASVNRDSISVISDETESEEYSEGQSEEKSDSYSDMPALETTTMVAPKPAVSYSTWKPNASPSVSRVQVKPQYELESTNDLTGSFGSISQPRSASGFSFGVSLSGSSPSSLSGMSSTTFSSPSSPAPFSFSMPSQTLKITDSTSTAITGFSISIPPMPSFSNPLSSSTGGTGLFASASGTATSDKGLFGFVPGTSTGLFASPSGTPSTSGTGFFASASTGGTGLFASAAGTGLFSTPVLANTTPNTPLPTGSPGTNLELINERRKTAINPIMALTDGNSPIMSLNPSGTQAEIPKARAAEFNFGNDESTDDSLASYSEDPEENGPEEELPLSLSMSGLATALTGSWLAPPEAYGARVLGFSESESETESDSDGDSHTFRPQVASMYCFNMPF